MLLGISGVPVTKDRSIFVSKFTKTVQRFKLHRETKLLIFIFLIIEKGK